MDNNLTLFSVPENSLTRKLKISTKTDSKRSTAIKEARLIPWPSNYFICESIKDLGKVARAIATAREFAFDVETNSLYWPTGDLLCLSIWADNKAFLINFKHLLMNQFTYEQVATHLGQYFTDNDYKRYGFNIKFDAHWIERFLKIKVGYLHFDAYLASWFIETDLLPGHRRLKPLCEKFLGDTGKSFNQLFGNTSWAVVDPKVAAFYACHDAEMHYKLSKCFEKELAEYEPHVKLFNELDMPVLNMDYHVEREGFLMDGDYLRNDLAPKLENQLRELHERMKDLGMDESTNPASDQQLAQFLYGTLGLKQVLGTSTSRAVLEQFLDLHPVIEPLLEWKSVYKLKTAFVDSLQELIVDGKVHPSIKTTGTETGRSAMESPNLQQMPAKAGPIIRKAFITEPGWMYVSKDLKGQELRILGHFCGPGPLAKVAVQGTIYEECAASFYGVPASDLKKGDERRDNGKKAWLAMQYGAQEGKISGIFKCAKAKAKDFIDNLFNKRFPEIGTFQRNAIAFSKKHGFIRGILGRKRHLHYDRCTDQMQVMALERYAINTPIQQTASEQLKVAFMLCNQWLEQENKKTKAVLRIHDEIIFRVWLEEWNDEMDAMLDSIIVNAIPMDVEFETTTEYFKPDSAGISRWGVN